MLPLYQLQASNNFLYKYNKNLKYLGDVNFSTKFPEGAMEKFLRTVSAP